jgi:hypothetical protein
MIEGTKIGRPANWIFLAQWCGISIATFPALLVLVGGLGNPAELPLPSIVRVVLYGVLIGAVIGGLQWIVLHSYMPKAGWWIVATIVGFTLGFLLSYGMTQLFNINLAQFTSDPSNLVSYIVLGILASGTPGFLQWLILRRRVAKSGWWVLAWILGSAGAVAIYAIGSFSDSGTALSGYRLVTILLCSGLGLGVITGVPLLLILRRTSLPA